MVRRVSYLASADMMVASVRTEDDQKKSDEMLVVFCILLPEKR